MAFKYVAICDQCNGESNTEEVSKVPNGWIEVCPHHNHHLGDKEKIFCSVRCAANYLDQRAKLHRE